MSKERTPSNASRGSAAVAATNGERLERQLGHYLVGSDDGANRHELWKEACRLLEQHGCQSLAAKLEAMAAEVVAHLGGQR